MVTLKQVEDLCDSDGVFFLTIKSINGLPILLDKKYYQVILSSLKYGCENKGWKIYAYTILINHLHLVLKVLKGYSLSGTISDFKSFTAHEILKLLRKDKQYNILDELAMAANKMEDCNYKIWRRSCWPEAITSRKFLLQKVKYVDNNAAKHRIVRDIESYLYTSYHNHYCEHEVVLDIDDIKELI